jgi:hypothetical protein
MKPDGVASVSRGLPESIKLLEGACEAILPFGLSGREFWTLD